MKTLKEKWSDALPTLLAIIVGLGILAMVIIGMARLVEITNRPDTRTIQEVKEARYKYCILTISVDKAEQCNNYLK